MDGTGLAAFFSVAVLDLSSPRADFFTFVETKAMESGRKGRREEGEIVRDERR